MGYEDTSFMNNYWNGSSQDVMHPSNRTKLDPNFLTAGAGPNAFRMQGFMPLNTGVSYSDAMSSYPTSDILGGSTTGSSDFRMKGFMPNNGTTTPPPSNSFLDNFKTPEGIAAAAKGVGALGGLFLGLKNSRLAKDQLNFQKDAFMKQFNMQVEDRERSRARAKAAATGVSQY